jgi:hypothetical protein
MEFFSVPESLGKAITHGYIEFASFVYPIKAVPAQPV